MSGLQSGHGSMTTVVTEEVQRATQVLHLVLQPGSRSSTPSAVGAPTEPETAPSTQSESVPTGIEAAWQSVQSLFAVGAARAPQAAPSTQSESVPPGVEAAWQSVQSQVAHQVNEEVNTEFIQALAAFIEARNMSEESARNTAALVILKKIRNIIADIIAGYPADVHSAADRVMGEIDKRLAAAGEGTAGPTTSSSTSSSSGANISGRDVHQQRF
jgi:hypothetical protein